MNRSLLGTSAGELDKTTIPEYFILAGAGEGKSHTAQELPKMLIECATNNTSLQTCLKDVLTFNLSFENGTRLFWGEVIKCFFNYCTELPNITIKSSTV
ncbi:17105_t:CDS:2 [Entrophospora sp. SA101]|nr:3502_t:CDS:2 [Entrophospora sp. SA101]CAJ0759289.1 17105_t:CDS:2 [Entrophospora sp. SA101]CAJ0906160.1 6366_t:CDS:2 [Entrophospora sp. SA101]CAJ0914153.1 15809_t:CDS:2 [Entrophospora sp. SA101]